MPTAPRRSARPRKPQARAWWRVAIVGTGLIGSSIGLALHRRRLAGEVIGVARTAATLRAAKRSGAIDVATRDIAEAAAEADLVIVCTPVEQIADHVLAAARASRAGALITDAGSTKAAIVAEVEAAQRDAAWPAGVRYIGSHPLAGNDRRGPKHAAADLFEGRVVVLTPGESANPKDVRALRGFWKSLGAQVVEMSAAEHDRAVAATSHLPHLVAAAIAAATPKQYAGLCATGWQDTTRIAAGDPELWRQIFLANRANVLAALSEFEAALARFREALVRGDAAEVTDLLTRAKAVRDAVAS